jgi:hypothetical protein
MCNRTVSLVQLHVGTGYYHRGRLQEQLVIPLAIVQVVQCTLITGVRLAGRAVLCSDGGVNSCSEEMDLQNEQHSADDGVMELDDYNKCL